MVQRALGLKRCGQKQVDLDRWITIMMMGMILMFMVLSLQTFTQII